MLIKAAIPGGFRYFSPNWLTQGRMNAYRSLYLLLPNEGTNRLTNAHRGDLLFLLPAFQPPLFCHYSFCADIPADAPVPLAVFLLLFLMAAGTSPLLSMYSLTAWGTYFSYIFPALRSIQTQSLHPFFPMYCLIAFSFSSSYLMVTTACFMFIYLRISK